MRKSVSKLVMQPSFRAVGAKHTWNGRHLKNLKIRDKRMAVRHGMPTALKLGCITNWTKGIFGSIL